MHRRIFLLRHGDVDYFNPDGTPAKFHDVPLNPHGLAQAREMRPLIEGMSFQKILISGLLRTAQTLHGVLGEVHAVETVPDFCEIEPSAIHPLPGQDLDLWKENFLGALGPGLTPESLFMGGESFGHFTTRVNRSLDKLLADQGWENALVVAHSVVNRWIISRLLDLGLDGISAFEQDAGCLNVIDLPGKARPILRLLNYTPLDRAKSRLRKNSLQVLLDKANEAMQKVRKSG